MPCYLYVVCAPNLQTSKIGYSKNLWSRLAGLASSSSAPFKWVPWRAYQVESAGEARKLERLVASDKALGEFKEYSKTEFFKCRPSALTKVIERLASEHSIDLLKNMPCNIRGVSEIAGDFCGLPKDVLLCMPENARLAYWMGVRHTLRAFAYLDRLQLVEEDVWGLYRLIDVNEAHNEPVVWETIISYFRNNSEPTNRAIAEKAIMRASTYDAHAFADWQESEGD
jgi:hypothetical protein